MTTETESWTWGREGVASSTTAKIDRGADRTRSGRPSERRAGEVYVEVKGVTLRRGGLVVLRDVNFTLGPGLHALVGANGSGKSTLLRALAGILSPASGTIAIAGHDLWREEVPARRALGYLPESPEFFPYLTARELLETAGSVRGAGTQRGIERFVGWVGEGALDRTLGTLSAGQRRKLALAAATATEPPVLLLDEPSNTLDLAALDDLRALLEQARERCVVVATHNLERLGLELDRTLIVRDGRVETPAVGVTGQAAPRGPGSS